MRRSCRGAPDHRPLPAPRRASSHRQSTPAALQPQRTGHSAGGLEQAPARRHLDSRAPASRRSRASLGPGRPSQLRLQLAAHLAEDAGPVVGRRLPEQAHRRVPGRVGAVEHSFVRRRGRLSPLTDEQLGSLHRLRRGRSERRANSSAAVPHSMIQSPTCARRSGSVTSASAAANRCPAAASNLRAAKRVAVGNRVAPVPPLRSVRAR